LNLLSRRREAAADRRATGCALTGPRWLIGIFHRADFLCLRIPAVGGWEFPALPLHTFLKKLSKFCPFVQANRVFFLCYKGMKRNILGKGLAFPVGPDVSGAVGMSAYEKSVEESIRIILGTTPGERLMRPDFGCRINEMVFAPNSHRTLSLAEHYVREALVRWEPRIILKEVRGGSDPENPSVVNIRIHYKIRSVNTFFNMVYPFFLERGESDSQKQFG
jgi:phage baseplate assembly protein W